MSRSGSILNGSLALTVGASLLVFGLVGATSAGAQERDGDDLESSSEERLVRRDSSATRVSTVVGAATATITVNTTADEFNTGAQCSLREAVEAADTDAAFGGCSAGSGADTIILPTGTLTLSIAPVGDADDNASGDIDVNTPVTIQGAGTAATTINGGGLDRIFDIFSGPYTAELSSLTITGGSAGSGFTEGGAFWCSVDLTVRDVALVNNEAGGDGGAFACSNGTVTVVNSTISGNESGGDGGAIWVATPLVISSSTITNNEGVDDGGGIAIDGSTLSLTDSTVSGNRSGDLGGGLNIDGEGTILRSTISGNEAPDTGGGIQARTDSTVQVTNSTVSGNRANESGGGIRLDSGGGVTLSTLNVTITGNVADADGTGGDSGGGMSNGAATNVANVKNTILAGNTVVAPGTGPDCAGDPFVSQGNNIVGTTADCTFPAAGGDKLNTDPRLGPLADNGGPTRTHAIAPGSPAVNAAGAGAPDTDQRGVARVGPPDIGAYELALCLGVPINRIGTDGNDVIVGTPGRDGVRALGGNDTINTEAGGDAVCAGGGNDRARAKGGKDRLVGEAGKDALRGGPGKDTVAGQAGKDTLAGQGGNDKLKGGGSNDKLKGGPKNDLHNGGPGRDLCKDGAGNNVFRSCELP